MWVIHDSCKSPGCRRSDVKRYNPLKSSSHAPSDIELSVTFGTGKITGSLGEDTFSFGSGSSSWQIHNQTFGMVEKQEHSIFERIHFEGILGLAFPSMSAEGETPLFDNIMDQKPDLSPEISFYFAKPMLIAGEGPSTSRGSSAIIGGVDDRLFQSPMHMLEVGKFDVELDNGSTEHTYHYWQTGLQSVTLDFPDGRAVEVCCGDKSGRIMSKDERDAMVNAASAQPDSDGKPPAWVIWDTGTSYNTFPKNRWAAVDKYVMGTCSSPDIGEVLSKMTANIQFLQQKVHSRADSDEDETSSSTTKAPTGALQGLPTITYHLWQPDGQSLIALDLPPEYWMVQEPSGGCSEGVMQLDVGDNFGNAFLLGDVLLRRFYTTYVRESRDGKTPPYVGVALANHDAPLVDHEEDARPKENQILSDDATPDSLQLVKDELDKSNGKGHFRMVEVDADGATLNGRF